MKQSALQMSDISFDYKIHSKPSGFSGRVKNVFFPNLIRKKALRQISLEIPEGCICGLIGRNGSGKSTLIKLALGLMRPTSGNLDVLGQKPWHKRNIFLKKIGVVFGHRTQMWWDLPVLESLKLVSKFYELSNADFQESLNNIVGILEISDLLNLSVRNLSLGQRVRCELACALIHEPKILFLDEPTIGLDTLARRNLLSQLVKVSKSEVTVILATHNLDDIEKACDKIVMIHDGSLHFDGSTNEFFSHFGDYRVIKLSAPINILSDVEKLTQKYSDVVVSAKAEEINIRFNATQYKVRELIDILNPVMGLVADLHVHRATLDDIVFDIYNNNR